jgi:hypothetical protein
VSPFVPQAAGSRPSDRPKVIAVAGASGPRASFMAGAFDALEDHVEPIHWVAASGGCIPALVSAAGMQSSDRQAMNAGAPWPTFLQRAEGVARPLGPLERRNADLAGTYDLRNYERWLEGWLSWSGVKTWKDLRYEEAEARPSDASHKVSMSVVVWRAKGAMSHLYAESTLNDPAFVHWAFRKKYFSSSFPLASFEEVWLPDHADRLKDVVGFEDFEDRSPAEAAHWSASLWPAVVCRVGQDRRTKELVFIADGGHIHNQPFRWNDGTPPPTLIGDGRSASPLPMVNIHSKAKEGSKEAPQLRADRRAVPFGLTVRAPHLMAGGVKGLREMTSMTTSDRVAMYADGLQFGHRVAAPRVQEYLERFPRMLDVAEERHGGVVQPVLPLHGFRAVAAKRQPGVRTSVFELNW